MKILFDESAKGFSTVKFVFEFMRCCKLAELVKTYRKEPTKAAAAWTLANNSILLNRRANTNSVKGGTTHGTIGYTNAGGRVSAR